MGHSSENKTDAELAEEFGEYLKIIGEEVSDPIKHQVDRHSDIVNQLSGTVDKLESDLREDVLMSLQKQGENINKQLVKIYQHQQALINKQFTNQQTLINKQLDTIGQEMQKKIDLYEERTTQRLMQHRWFELLAIVAVVTLVILVN